MRVGGRYGSMWNGFECDSESDQSRPRADEARADEAADVRLHQRRKRKPGGPAGAIGREAGPEGREEEAAKSLVRSRACAAGAGHVVFLRRGGGVRGCDPFQTRPACREAYALRNVLPTLPARRRAASCRDRGAAAEGDHPAVAAAALDAAKYSIRSRWADCRAAPRSRRCFPLCRPSGRAALAAETCGSFRNAAYCARVTGNGRA